MVAELIIFAYSKGYEITLGDAYRDPQVFGEMGEKKGYGHSSSYHKKRLAIDLNLFRDGRYITDYEGHQVLGEYWEFIGGSWGGRFDDPNHYSYGESR